MSEWPQESSLSITLNTGDWEKQLEDARQRARELERGLIVEWLREEAEMQVLEHNVYPEDTSAHWYARAIERGEHLRGDDE